MSTALLASAFCLLSFLSACAGTQERAPASPPGATASISAAAENQQRMVISDAYLAMDVDDIEKTVDAVVAAARKHNGYVVSSGTTTVIRVEAAGLADALKEVQGLGTVTSREIREQDVTKQYSDTTLRLENAKAARERYLELLAKAEDVQAALAVEKELERLNGEITLLESDLGNLAHLTQYATIHVSLHKRVKPGPLGWIFYGLYKVIEWLFVWP